MSNYFYFLLDGWGECSKLWKMILFPKKSEGETNITIAWDDNSVTCSCVYIGFKFALRLRSVKRNTQTYEKWSLFSIFSNLCHFPKVFEEVQECFMLKLQKKKNKSVTWSCVPNCFYIVLWGTLDWKGVKSYETW